MCDLSKDSVKTWAEFNAAVGAGEKPESLLGLDELLPQQQTEHHHGNKDEASTSFDEKMTVRNIGYASVNLQYRYSHFNPANITSTNSPIKLEPLVTLPYLPVTDIIGPCFIGNHTKPPTSAATSNTNDGCKHKQ